MDRNTVILLLSIALLMVVGVLTFSGCSCFAKEGFTNPDIADKEQKKPIDLTKDELSLFQDIKEGKVSDKDVQKLIDSNVINESLIEKFIQKIDRMSESKTSDDDKSIVKSAPAPPKDDDDSEDFEPFTNGSSGYPLY